MWYFPVFLQLAHRRARCVRILLLGRHSRQFESNFLLKNTVDRLLHWRLVPSHLDGLGNGTLFKLFLLRVNSIVVIARARSSFGSGTTES